MKEKDKKHIEQAVAIYNHHKDGGVKGNIPKSGSHRDTCIRGMGHEVGFIQGYLLALKENNIISQEQWEEEMKKYVYGK